MTDDAATRRDSSVPRAGRRRAASVPMVEAELILPVPVDATPAKPKRRAARRKTPVVEPLPPPPPVRRLGPINVDGLWDAAGAVNVKLIYAAYLVALAVPAAALLGIALAYLFRRGSPPEWLASHYTYLVRTFWIGLAASAVQFVLSLLGIGLLAPLIAVWLVARAVHGLNRAARAEPIDHPTGYFV